MEKSRNRYVRAMGKRFPRKQVFTSAKFRERNGPWYWMEAELLAWGDWDDEDESPVEED